MKSALVTGAGGFAGTHLCLFLLSKGYRVIALDRSGKSVSNINKLYNFYSTIDDAFIKDISAGYNDKLITVQADLNRLAVTDFSGIRSENLESVYHLAGMAFVPDGWKDPVSVLDANTAATVRLAQALTDCGFSGTFVYAGSGDVYGPGRADPDSACKETDELIMKNPYAASKRSAELFLTAMPSNERPFQVVLARPFNHIGPAQSEQFVVPSFLLRIRNSIQSGEKVIRAGDLQSGRDFTDVRDVAAAYFTLAQKGKNREVYNICSSNCIRIGELLRMAMEVQNAELEFDIDQSLLRPDGVGYRIGDYSKLASLDWHPKIPLKKTLTDTLRFLEYSKL